MIDVSKKNKNKLFILILILSSIFFVLYLFKLSQDYYWRYVYSDWIINYKGGYIKRGLLGQSSIIFNDLFNIGFKNTFIIIHSSIYLLFHYFFYQFFKGFKKNYLFILICFSPLVFLFPIYVNDALARKEIFFITIFLINCYFLTYCKSYIVAFFSTNIFLIISCLIHEAVLFFSFFFYATFYLFLFKKKIKANYFVNSINLFIIVLLFYINTRPIEISTINQMLFFINNNSDMLMGPTSGAIPWLTQLNEENSLFRPLAHKLSILLHLCYLHFVVFFYFIIFKFSNFNNSKNLKFLYVINIFFISILFYIAQDWGRFVYITYNFLLIFTFFLLHDKKNIFLEIDQIEILKKIPLSIKAIFSLAYISSWSPGLQYFDKIHFFPLMDFFIKNILYLKKYHILIL